MHRDLQQLENEKFDLLVIGGGIYGACVAWDAALRGLTVGLIDQGDFGQATSANSLKIIHGGLRYLQDGNPWLMRKMSVERMNWMRIAPQLVHPLACLTPTYHRLTRSKSAYTAGLLINDLISFDRNRLADPQKHLPKGQILTRKSCIDRLPGIRPDGITGGALWYDAQIFNSERLLLSIVLSAAQAGAVAANYVKATRFLIRNQTVYGIQALDQLSGQELEIQARCVINCTGAWMDEILALAGATSNKRVERSTAINLVTRQILAGPAVGFLSQTSDSLHGGTEKSRMIFMTPWRGCSIIGTIHEPYPGKPDDFEVSEETIQKFLAEINLAYPGAELEREDVCYVHHGFLPMVAQNNSTGPVRLLRESQIHDHQKDVQLAGLVSIVGVKYTTARKTAQEAVDLVLKKLGHKNAVCKTQAAPVYGGQIADFQQFQSELKNTLAGMDADLVEYLAHAYGSSHPDILTYIRLDPVLGKRISGRAPILRAEVVHAIREEMAVKLTDIVFRRTELASTGKLDVTSLTACAQIMAEELGWDLAAKNQAISETWAAFRAIHGMTEAQSLAPIGVS